MWFGRVSRKMILAHPKTNSSQFSCQTRLELQTEQGAVVRLNKQTKNSFLVANTLDGFGAQKDKKYPMCTI